MRQSLRELVMTQNIEEWKEEHTASFERVKKMLAEAPVLALFDPKLPVVSLWFSLMVSP